MEQETKVIVRREMGNRSEPVAVHPSSIKAGDVICDKNGRPLRDRKTRNNGKR